MVCLTWTIHRLSLELTAKLRGARQLRRAGSTILSVAVLWVCLFGGCGGEPPATGLTARQQAELNTLTGQLADPTRSGQTKLDAASLLLSKSYPEAENILVGFLAAGADPSSQLAVAEAMAREGAVSKKAVDPLLALLKSDEPAVRLVAGKALAASGDESVTDRLVGIAGDGNWPIGARVAAIRGLAGVSDKRTVELMVGLFADRRKEIDDAAAESLAEMTGIRAFGRDKAKWETWWEANKSKKRGQWLSDLVERLGKTVGELEAANASLRDRLGQATRFLYDGAGPEQRDAILLDLLSDPMAELRLIGTELLQRRLSANEEIRLDSRLVVQGMLSDPDPRCRSAAAMVLAGIGNADCLPDLLTAVEEESDAGVRRQLLSALGQLRRPQAMKVVLSEVSSSDDSVAAAAAEALARIVEANGLTDEVRSSSAKALKDRYNASAGRVDAAKLREALLTAMGAVSDPSLYDVVEGALRDRAATVRLAAVGALSQAGDKSATALLLELTTDPDRGVRQAAVSAIGMLGGREHLDSLLERTDPSFEPDASVRDEAWKVVMSELSGCGPETMRAVAEMLSLRADAEYQRIEVLRALSETLKGSKASAEADALRQLGLALMKAGRPAEAATPLAESWQMYEAVGGEQAMDVWREWIGALLMTSDPNVVKAMNDQTDDEGFNFTLRKLVARLTELHRQSEYSSVILLATAAIDGLSQRLTESQRQAIEKLAGDASVARADADRQEVERLVSQLQTSDRQAQNAAMDRLSELGQRAARPLLAKLGDVLRAEEIDDVQEKAIISALEQAAPEFKGYDPSASRSERVAALEKYLTGSD